MQNLTVEDLHEIPIWEFSGSGAPAPNDGVVRPRPDLAVHDLSEGSGALAVLTGFVLADGTNMTGYSSAGAWPPPFLGYLQPAILTPAGHVPFWFSLDEEPRPDFARTYYEMLGAHARRRVPDPLLHPGAADRGIDQRRDRSLLRPDL